MIDVKLVIYSFKVIIPGEFHTDIGLVTLKTEKILSNAPISTPVIFSSSCGICSLSRHFLSFLKEQLPFPLREGRWEGALGGAHSGQRAIVALSVLLVWPEQPSHWCNVTGTDVTYRFRHTSIPPVTGSGWLTSPCSGPVPPLQDNTTMLEWTSPSPSLLPGMGLP